MFILWQICLILFFHVGCFLTGFSMVYAVNGVLREQVYELLVYALTAVVLTLYALFNYLDPETPRGAIKLVSRLDLFTCILCVRFDLGIVFGASR